MLVFPFVLALCLGACFEPHSEVLGGHWSVPQQDVLDGGPGKDGIPAVNSPNFYINASEAPLNDEALVVAFRHENTIRAYSHVVLDYHEIVNDQFNTTDVVISYCPLTGSSMVWEGEAEFRDKSFGVSGLLYNSNLILYDRATDSNWSQMKMSSIQGTRLNRFARQLSSSEMSFSTWKKLYPNEAVLNLQTGSSRQYGRYPYGNYKNSKSLIFSTNNMNDTRLFSKERVLGVKVAQSTKAFPLSKFTGPGVNVHEEILGKTAISIWASQGLNFAVAFNRTLSDGTLLNFAALSETDFPAVVMDNEGSRWDVFGIALSGPRSGQSLNQPFSHIAYWFAWTAFHPNGEIYKTPE